MSVLKEVGEKRSLFNNIMKMKIKFFGHLNCHNDFLINIFEGGIMEQR